MLRMRRLAKEKYSMHRISFLSQDNQNLKDTILWNVAPCSLTEHYVRFRGTFQKIVTFSHPREHLEVHNLQHDTKLSATPTVIG
jgi:hypothetical protein